MVDNEYKPEVTCDPYATQIPQAQPNYSSYTTPSTSSAFYPPAQIHRDPLGKV
jgi:hypothetical protein